MNVKGVLKTIMPVVQVTINSLSSVLKSGKLLVVTGLFSPHPMLYKRTNKSLAKLNHPFLDPPTMSLRRSFYEIACTCIIFDAGMIVLLDALLFEVHFIPPPAQWQCTRSFSETTK